MSIPADQVALRPGSAAVTNLLRLVRSESEATAAFAAVPGEGGRLQIFAVPPAGSAGGLGEGELEELARQVSADPELPYARVLVRVVHRPQPFTVAAAPIEGLSGVIAIVGPADKPFQERDADALHRVAVRLSRHFHALRELVSPGGLTDPTPGPEGPVGDERGSDPGRWATGALPSGAPPATDSPRPQATNPAPPAEAPMGPMRPATGGGVPVAEPLAAATPRPGRTPPAPPERPSTTWWVFPDEQTGLASVARFFSQVGRLLASGARESGAFALVLVEIPTAATAPAAARALTSQLRCSDPVARIDADLFAAGVLLLPGTARGEVVEDRLAGAVRGALEWLSPVRTTHVLAEPGDRREVDELVRQALSALSGRRTGGGGAPWRGAGGSAARLPFP